jgi:hypothetical protein
MDCPSQWTDAQLIGPWKLERLDPLTDTERLQLISYRRRTHRLAARFDRWERRGPSRATTQDLRAELAQWDSHLDNLQAWHSQPDRRARQIDTNPITKILIFEHARITNIRIRLIEF